MVRPTDGWCPASGRPGGLLGVFRPAGGQGYQEARPTVLRVRRPDPAAVPLDDMSANEQAQAQAREMALGVGLVEPLEQPRAPVGRDAETMVPDSKLERQSARR